MRTLRNIVNRYILLLAAVSVAAILGIIIYIQIQIERNLAYEQSTQTFSQIEQILDENQKELAEIQEEYTQTCLNNAEAIARVVEGEPELIYDVDGLEQLAKIIGVDEIHFFDETGRIFAGTHPEYYGFTFESGEQIGFFRPMLEDKSLRLVQDITPNTAQSKPMQYSAVWNRKGDIIVQVGMAPTSVMKVRAKNELSYIFSLFSVSPDVNYYAVNADSGRIVGATVPGDVGKTLGEIGLELEALDAPGKGFFTQVDGEDSYCVFKRSGENYLGRIVPTAELYRRVPITVLELVACLAVIVMVLLLAIATFIDKIIVKDLREINGKLLAIEKGNYDERVNIRGSFEFSELSDHLNAMIRSLLSNSRKMAYVLSKTNIRIGVYEYNSSMQRVHFTEYLPGLLGLDSAQMEALAADYGTFRAFLDELHERPVPDEPGVFQQQSGRYVKLEESRGQDEIFGVAIDVTDEVLRRRKLELERDMDPLTGLYNRRGLDLKLAQLFREPEKLGHSAVVMIDADGLKTVNDTYGHEMGDAYLKKTAALICSLIPEHSVAARQGGDEFVLFLYRYGSQEQLLRTLEELEGAQDHVPAAPDAELPFPVRFSMGYCLTGERTDFAELIKDADRQMYTDKRRRKGGAPGGREESRKK